MGRKLFVIVGLQGSGKTTLLDQLKANKNLRILTPSTQRPKRTNEPSTDYHFETEWKSENFAWEISRGPYNYGMRKSEIDSDFEIGITVFDPANIDIFLKKIPEIDREVITVGLDTIADINAQHDRVLNDASRKIDDPKNFELQIKAVKNCDVVLAGNKDTIFSAFETIIELITGRGGRLHDDAIKKLIAANGLLENASESQVQTASYDLTLGDKYWCQGKYTVLDDKNSTATIPPYSYILVQAKEIANLPRFVSGDFDTTVSLFLNGIILSNGPQVDPGYKGALFCMLYNASHTPMGITRGKHFATIQFTTTCNNAVGYRDKYQNKKLFEDFLDGKVSVGPGGKIFEELEKVEKTLKSEVSVWRNSLIGLNTFIIGLVITLFGLAYTGFNNLSQEKIKIVDKKIDNLTSLEKDIESQKETLAATEKEYKEKIRILNEEMQSTSKEKLSNKRRASK